jgi:hypothetical protein
MRRLLLLPLLVALAAGGAVSALAASAPSRSANASAASRCPGSEPHNQATSKRAGSAGTLVPQTPDAVLICRYNGLPQPSGKIAGFTLTGAQALGATQTAALATAFDALKEFVPGKTYNCPLDSGSQAVLHFSYPSGDGVTVTVDLSGCTKSTNGAPRYFEGTPIPYEGYPAALKTLAVGSKSFIRAHEDLLIGTATWCGGPFPGGCHNQTGTIQVNASNGDWVAGAAVRKGKFSVYVTPGRDKVQLLNSGYATPSKSITAKGGGTTHVHLQLDTP